MRIEQTLFHWLFNPLFNSTEMIPYKIALVTSTGRVDVAAPFTDYQSAKEHLCKFCATCSGLPIDAVCILEQNALVVEAYRFVPICTLHIIGNNILASRILARRKSLTGMPCCSMTDPEQLLRKLDMGDATMDLEAYRLKRYSKKYREDKRRSMSLGERIQRVILTAFTSKSSSLSQRTENLRLLQK